jgi:hypothetical protein
MTAVVVPLPIKTVSEANQREHWAKKARRVSDQRNLVALALRVPVASLGIVLAPRDRKRRRKLTMGGLGAAPALVEVTLTRIAPRELDDDNLRGALKATRDAVADVLGTDDRDPRIAWRYAQRQGGIREYGVQIMVAKLPAQEMHPLSNSL